MQPMKAKAESYYEKVLKKPVYMCALILDPRSKDKELSDATLNLAGINHCDDWKTLFLNECRKFHEDIPAVNLEDRGPQPEDCPQSFVTRKKAQGIKAELQTYLSSEQDDKGCDLLTYWQTKSLHHV